MLLASTKRSPAEPVSFTLSLPARSTKQSTPCWQELGSGLSCGEGEGLKLSGVLLHGPSGTLPAPAPPLEILGSPVQALASPVKGEAPGWLTKASA